MCTWHKLQLLSTEISLHRKHFSGVGKQRKTVRGTGFSVCCPHEKWGESQNEKTGVEDPFPWPSFTRSIFRVVILCSQTP